MKRFKQKPLGPIANFLLPSLKLKQTNVIKELERQLLKKFGGFTVTIATIAGMWIDDKGKLTHGEHVEYKVGVQDKEVELKEYLATIARKLGEKTIYLEIGGQAYFISA